MKIKSFKTHIFALFGFIAIGFYAIADVSWRFNSMYYGRFADALGWLWQFWWYKYSWVQGISAGFVPLRAYPFGVKSQSLYPIWDIINRWLAIIIGDISAYNLQIMLAFVLSGLAVYFLIYSFTKSRLAAFFSGCLFTLSPYHFARAWDHLSLSNLHWMIFYIQALFMFRQKRSLKRALLCGVFFGLIGHFSNFYYSYFMILFSIIFLVFTLMDDKYRQTNIFKKQLFSFIKGSLVICSTALVMIIPQIWTYIKVIFFKASMQSVSNPVRSFGELFADSARPLNYLLPTVYHPVLGGVARFLLGSPLYGENAGGEQSIYLGIVPIILAFIGYNNWRKTVKKGVDDPEESFSMRLFVFTFFFFMICSFSPYWGVKDGLFMPFPSFFLYKIFPMFRNYARMGVLVLLAVCVLGGFGYKAVLDKIRTKKNKILISCLLLVVLLFEFYNKSPFSIDINNSIPDVYKWISQEPADLVIVEYPIDADARGYLFYQRVHNKAMINGAPPGSYAEVVSKKIVDLKAPLTPGILKFLGVDYIILHEDKYSNYEGGVILGQIPDLKSNSEYILVKDWGKERIYEIVAKPIDPKTVTENNNKTKRKSSKGGKVEESYFGFYPGDQFFCSIEYLGIIPVLDLSVEVKNAQSKRNILIEADARSTVILAKILDVSVKLKSLIDKDLTVPLEYNQSVRTGRNIREKDVIFDREQLIMKSNDRKVSISEYTQDPLSAIFYISTLDFNSIDKFNVFINPGKTNYKLQSEVVGKTQIKSLGKNIDCWEVKGDYFSLKGKAKKIASVKMWFNVSSAKPLMRLEVFTKAGLITLEQQIN